MDANSVTAIATSVYGFGSLLLVLQLWRDRVQRNQHFEAEKSASKLRDEAERNVSKLKDLHSAFTRPGDIGKGKDTGRETAESTPRRPAEFSRRSFVWSAN
jgi:hypothetical protein